MCRMIVLPTIEQAPPLRSAPTVCYVEVKGERPREHLRGSASHHDLHCLKTSGEADRRERRPKPERRGYASSSYSEGGRLPYA